MSKLIKTKKCEKYLKEDLENVLDNLPFSTWIKDLGGTYLYANKSLCDIVGKKREDLIGTTDIEYWTKEECKYLKKCDKYIIENRIPKSFEVAFGEGEGESWYETYKAPIFDENNEIKYIVGTRREVTLSKKMNKRILESNSKLKNLNSTIDDNKKIIDEELIRTIKTDIVRWLDASEVSIWLYTKNQEKLELYVDSDISFNSLDYQTYKQIIAVGLYKDLKNEFIEGIIPIEEKNHSLYIDIMKIMGLNT